MPVCVAKIAVAAATYWVDRPYDYLIINDDADKAAKELSAIILAEHCRFNDRMAYLK